MKLVILFHLLLGCGAWCHVAQWTYIILWLQLIIKLTGDFMCACSLACCVMMQGFQEVYIIILDVCSG